MPNTECPPTRRAELFVRADLPTPAKQRREAVEEQLGELQCAGVIDTTETTVWRKRVPLAAEDCPERRRYDEFRAWASEADATLAPVFDTRSCYSWETGERRTELVMPALCLALYEDGDLLRLAPVTRGDTPRSIAECLDDLEEGRTPTATDSPPISTAD